MTRLETHILGYMPSTLSQFYKRYTDICRFIIIGGTATVVHFTVALIGHHLFGLTPLWANFVAFSVAFNVTYFGNYFWAFEADTAHKRALPKSLMVSLIGFLLSQLIVWVLTNILSVPFHITLIAAVTLVPVVTFSLNKLWVFKGSPV